MEILRQIQKEEEKVLRDKPFTIQLAANGAEPGMLLNAIKEYYGDKVVATDGFNCDVITEDGVYIMIRFVMEGLNRQWHSIYISSDEEYASIKKLRRAKMMRKFEMILEDFTEANDLNHGNGEYYMGEDGIIWIVEAPNNTTVMIDFRGSDTKKIEKLLLEEKYMEAINLIKDRLYNTLICFDKNEEFNNLWNVEFGEDNNFTAYDFMEMLKSDEDYFKDVLKELRGEFDYSELIDRLNAM